MPFADRLCRAVLMPAFSVIIFSACTMKESPEGFFPETGRAAVFQNSLDVQSNVNVLSIALQPGFESLPDLAYLRLKRGAAIRSAYLTNGEAGASDLQGEYPHYLAARRRTEATRALSLLNGEAYFLNMPDLAAAHDTATVREFWRSDTLQARLRRLILQFKPEIILIARDWALDAPSLRWEVMCAEILAAVKSCATPPDTANDDAAGSWQVQRVFVDDWQGGGVAPPVATQDAQWNKTYQEIGEHAASAYASFASQRRLLMNNVAPSYRLVYPAASQPAAVDEGLPLPGSPRLRRLEDEILQLTAYTLENKTDGILKRIAGVMDSLDILIAMRSNMTPRDRKTLLYWKKELDELRCAMLGVEVDFTISDTLLTDRQVTFLRITEVNGLSADGKTEVFFGPPEPGWAINEDVEPKLPLELNTEYRLLTPGDLQHSYPPGVNEFTLPAIGKPLYFFILHRAVARENSFTKRMMVNIVYAPKLVVENLTPVVRATPGERVVFQLTNVLRDGIADTLRIIEPLGFSFGHPFRISFKGATVRDTLYLGWEQAMPEGNHLLPVRVGTIPVGQFVARKFEAEVDAAKRVGLITGISSSPVAEALRRLHVDYVTVPAQSNLVGELENLSVLIIDQQSLTRQPQIATHRDALREFVNLGGHLIVLAQDAAAWNAAPLWDGMKLTPTLQFDLALPVEADAAHPLLTGPNVIAPDDWQEWLFQRSYNLISGPVLGAAVVPVQVGHQPSIVTLQEGKGRKTYVDLALHPQLLNIHPGAFRLLANLISY